MASGPTVNVSAQIEQMHQSIQSANHYELLGVEQDADASAINVAHRGLIKKFHIDALRRHGLTPEQEAAVQEINAAINAAKATLSNPDKRSEYDLELNGETGSSVVDIFNADALYLRGRTTLDRGAYQGALEMFEQALELNSEDRDIFLHVEYTKFLLLPKAEDGITVQDKKAARAISDIFTDELDSRDEVQDWLVAYAGTIALGVGRTNTAKSRFKRALKINPENKAAARQLRLLEMREERENNKGFFSKLMEKIGLTK